MSPDLATAAFTTFAPGKPVPGQSCQEQHTHTRDERAEGDPRVRSALADWRNPTAPEQRRQSWVLVIAFVDSPR